MSHIKALLVKFVMVSAGLGLVLSVGFGAEFGETLLISLILTAVAYVLGDMMVFRLSGKREEHTKRNIIATASDTVLSFLLIWGLGSAMLNNVDHLMIGSLISAIVIAGGEWFYHIYLDRHVFNYDRSARRTTSYS